MNLTRESGVGNGGRRRFLTNYLSVPHGIQKQLAIMIFGGVLERFPHPETQKIVADNAARLSQIN